MYKYRHMITQEIIEIEDIILKNMQDYLESIYIESWIHINDDTNKIDDKSDNYADDF